MFWQNQPTEEELAEPLVIIAEAGKTGLDVEPGAAVGAMVKSVVTIQVINLPFRLIFDPNASSRQVSI